MAGAFYYIDMVKTVLHKTAYLLLLCLLCLSCRTALAEEGPAPVPEPTASPEAATASEPLFRTADPAPFLQLRKALVFTGSGRYLDTATGQYYAFGNFGRGPVGFYPLDEEEGPVYGDEPLPLDDFLITPYAPETPPKKDGDRWLTVYLGSQSVVCFFARGGDWIVERIMICSAADESHRTPLGNHYVYSKYAYKAMTRMNGIMVYAQYASRFKGHYLFHTVPIGGPGRNTQRYGKKQMLIEEYEKLGSPASHGCVRLLVGDAHWVYANCPYGTRVLVTKEAGPPAPAAPALIYAEPYMSADQTLGWDPTDPDEENPYREIYPEWFE